MVADDIQRVTEIRIALVETVFGSATSGGQGQRSGVRVDRPIRAGGFAALCESRPARRARPMLRGDGAGLVVVVLGARVLGDRLPVRMMAVEELRQHGLAGGCRPRAS